MAFAWRQPASMKSRAAAAHVTCIGWVLAYTIAAEIGDIHRFPLPCALAGTPHERPRPDGNRQRRHAVSE
jgi:hypothetical protein